MNINSEKMKNKMVTLPYEQPSLKKYGTMKEFTLGTSGSGADGKGAINTILDADQIGDIVRDINTEFSNDSLGSLGNDGDDPPLLTNGSRD